MHGHFGKSVLGKFEAKVMYKPQNQSYDSECLQIMVTPHLEALDPQGGTPTNKPELFLSLVS